MRLTKNTASLCLSQPGHCNAHCSRPDHCNVPPFKCHLDRATGLPTAKQPGKGRVLGLHALWLEKGADAGTPRDLHAAVYYKKMLGSAVYRDERRAARGRLKLHPQWDLLRLAESAKLADGDGDSEPEVVP
jgi:hypothetical protein